MQVKAISIKLMLVPLFALISIPAIPALNAQVIAASAQKTGNAAASTAAPAQRIIAVNLKNVTLEQALEEIAAQAGMRLTYASAVTPIRRLVTLQAGKITAEKAMQRVLATTDLTAVVVLSGTEFIITKVRSNRIVAQGIITGKVIDAKSGRGISGANVSVGTGTRGVTTGEDGSYRLTQVAAGTHTVTVRLVGYAKQTRSVTVGEGATVTADFQLEPSSSVLDQVIVTGTIVATELKAVPNAITVVTAKQIEERGITRIDQLFRGDIPGLFAINSGSSNLLDAVSMYSRGSSALENSAILYGIKTYIDGVELVDSRYLSQIDPRSIERIEILTGPQASTIYGSKALNGVMQVFTKRGTTSRPQLTLNLLSGWVENSFRSSYTPQHDYSAQLSGVEGRLSYNAGGSWNYVGPWTPAKQTARTGGFGGVRLDIPTGAGPVTADVTFRRTITVNKQRGNPVQLVTNNVETGWYTYGAFDSGVSRPENRTLTGQTLGLTLGYTPTSWWSHEFAVGQDASDQTIAATDRGYQYESDTTLLFEQIHADRRTLRYTTTAQVPVTSLAQATVTLGADAWQDLSATMNVSPSQTLTGNLTGSTNIRRQPGHNTGAFVQTQIGFKDKLFLTYGLRAEWNPNFGDEAQPNYAPRYGVAYTQGFGPVTAKLRGSYGRATRPPEVGRKDAVTVLEDEVTAELASFFGNFDRTKANTALAPEHQQGGEGGIELYFGSRGSLVVTRYNQTVDGLIATPLVDSVRSLTPDPLIFGTTCADWISFGITDICSSQDADGYGYTPQYQNLNIGSIRNQGWELQGSVNTGPLTTRGTYSWTKSRTIGITPRYRAFFPASSYPQYQLGATYRNLPEHTWAIGMTYAHAQTTVALNVTGTGQISLSRNEFFAQNLANNIRLMQNRQMVSNIFAYQDYNKGYAMADLTAAHRFSTHIEGILQVQNLADHYTNDFFASYATIGRQTKAGLRIQM